MISIARAAVADLPVMILDEATSSIDTRTEALVQDGMDNLMKGRTVLSLPIGYQPFGTAKPLWYWTTAESLNAAVTRN